MESKTRALFVAVMLLLICPALYAGHGPADAPPAGYERFITYWGCVDGTHSYVGFEQYDCDGVRYSDNNTANYAQVSDTNCETFIEESVTYWCKNSQGWGEISEAAFNACRPCFEVEVH